jgi:uncharacterized protein YndB with AHSA1/START domain
MKATRSEENKLKVEAQGDREIVITRNFNAPRELVFRAHTEPGLVKRWLLGPEGWTMPVCEIDLKVGGKYRYVWRKEKTGDEMGMGGTFNEIDRPARLVATENFDDPWYEGEGLSTATFTENNGTTAFRNVVRYESKEARDGVLQSPMESGMIATYDRLETLLATL